jgi:hypothetical protein
MIESLQLAAVLGVFGLFLGVFLKPSVRIKNDENMVSILRDLKNRSEYSTLVNVLDDQYETLVNHPQKPSRRDNLLEQLKETEEDKESKSIFRRLTRSLKDVYQVQLFLYFLENTAEEASSYIEILFLDPEFSSVYPKIYPELGIRLIRDDSLVGFPRRKAVQRYLWTLIHSENSLLYRDLEHNTSTDGVYSYKIEESNRLIYALFSQFERVEKLDAYKPVGEAVREIVVDQRSKEFDPYTDQRLTDTRVSDDYVFRDPVFIGIQFFDVMVKEAFDKKITWHVWLSYYETFTEEICRNYEITEYSEPDASVPNDYSRLLNEMISNMIDWMKMMENEYLSVKNDGEEWRGDGQEDLEHLELRGSPVGRDLASIPKMCGIILISCNMKILTTDEIPDYYKERVTERILLCGVELRHSDEGTPPWEYSELMLKNMEMWLSGRRSDPVYQTELRRAYEEIRDELIVNEDVGVDYVDRLDDLIRGP